MQKVFYIKNMVCDRCKSKITQIVHENHAEIKDLQLGKISILPQPQFDEEKFSNQLTQEGFELIKNPDLQTVEAIKTHLLKIINTASYPENLSEFLAKKLYKDYSVLSKLFKKNAGETLEKYFIKLKIEKVKELIQMQKFTFSEIAHQLNYNNISHLSSQFKNTTGMTMSAYQNQRNWDRSSLDKII